MPTALVSLVLAGLGRDLLKVAVTLALAVVLALAFTISSLIVLLGALFPGLPAGVPVGPVSGSAPGVIPANPVAEQVVELARAEIGTPYVWGGASPQTGFDCSGLVQWAYRRAGINLPRTAQEQYDATARVSPEQLRPGDTVYFARTYPSADRITHVGIYIGDGMMIDAPDEGDVVRAMPVFTGYWGAHYAGAGRVRE